VAHQADNLFELAALWYEAEDDHLAGERRVGGDVGVVPFDRKDLNQVGIERRKGVLAANGVQVQRRAHPNDDLNIVDAKRHGPDDSVGVRSHEGVFVQRCHARVQALGPGRVAAP
jgi:hypothetical protein